MKCTAFFAQSADGYIAGLDDDVTWLEHCGDPSAAMADQADMGFNEFIAQVDCLVMGRRTFEKLLSFHLTAEQWPYRDAKLYVLSHQPIAVPPSFIKSVQFLQGEIIDIVDELRSRGHQHAYIDGGITVSAFIAARCLQQLIITQAPILLGCGTRAFSQLPETVQLQHGQATTFANGFIQLRYNLHYHAAPRV